MSHTAAQEIPWLSMAVQRLECGNVVCVQGEAGLAGLDPAAVGRVGGAQAGGGGGAGGAGSGKKKLSLAEYRRRKAAQ